jgi:pyridoxal phosphate enzyme (YggS family)
MNVTSSILIQVNVSGEETKHGFEPHQMNRIIDLAGQCSNIKLCGLMTMAPIQTGEHEALPIFDKTNELFMNLKNQTMEPDDWTVLSMGMSQDYIDAIQCGATHIRIGTAIFGQRIY